MDNCDRELDQLKALVQENRNAFDRAQRLLSAMQGRETVEVSHSGGHDALRAEPLPLSAVQPAPAIREIVSGLGEENCWLDLEHLANVELGPGEDSVDFAASALAGRIWRAEQAGAQTVRLVFASPQSIAKIQLVFFEEEMERTQEFVLRWLPFGASALHEIVRQQYVFSPRGSIREIEEYRVELRNLVVLELSIIPDMSGNEAFASLAHLGLAAMPEQAGL